MNGNKPGSRRSLKSNLAQVDAHVVSSKEYEELPQLTTEMLSRAKLKTRWASDFCQSSKADIDSVANRRHRALESHRSGMADAHG
jgi:hypothetical protein